MKRKSLTVVNCDDCGACCQHMRSPPFVGSYLKDSVWSQADPDDTYGDHAALMSAPQEARDTIANGLRDGRPDSSPCSWLDQVTKRCRWWEHRPDVCRQYEIGGESCLAARRRVGVDPRTVYSFGRRGLKVVQQ